MPSPKPPRVVTLQIEDARGQRHSIALSGPGGTIRVAVGKPGRRSGVWRVWAGKKKFDVYVAARSIAGVQKFSLHETGDWRNQWVTPEQALRFTGSQARILDQWRRPGEVVGGWTKGISIWVPQRDVVDIEDDDQGEADVVWIPEPPPDHLTGLHIVVAKTNGGFVPVKGAVPIEAFTLVNGEVVIVLASRSKPTQETLERLEALRIRGMAESRDIDLSNAKAPRMSMYGFDNSGNRFVWDLAVHRS